MLIEDNQFPIQKGSIPVGSAVSKTKKQHSSLSENLNDPTREYPFLTYAENNFHKELVTGTDWLLIGIILHFFILLPQNTKAH